MATKKAAAPRARFPSDVPRFLFLLQTLAERALSLGEPADFWPLMARELCGFFGCERATLFQALRDGYASCYAGGVTKPIEIALGEGIAGHCARDLRSILCNDAYADPRFSSRIDTLCGFKTKNLLAVPLIAQGRVVGVVELLNKGGGFDQADMDGLELLGTQIATYFVLFSIGQRHDQLTLQMLQLEKMAALGRLVAGFTHEVRNPLFVISGFTQGLLEEDKLDAKTRDALDRILANTRRIEHMVKNVLSFSRPAADKKEIIDLGALLDTTLELVLVEHRWRAAKVTKEYAPGAPGVRGSVNSVMQVFLNLIVNALQAMERQRDRRLTLSVRPGKDPAHVVVEVSDSGPGLPPGAKDHLFEPFFTTKGKEGTGLGLYLVAGIVKAHGGRIEASSKPGKGTTFTITFPGVALPEAR